MKYTEEENQALIKRIRSWEAVFHKDDLYKYSDEALIAFAETNHSFIDQLPKERMTDKVLFAVAEHDTFFSVLSFVNPEDTTRYRDLAIKAVSKTPANLYFVDTSYVDKSFLLEVVTPKNPSAIAYFFKHYPALTSETFSPKDLESLLLHNAGIRNSFLHELLTFKSITANISDEFIRHSLPSSPGIIASILETDKRNLALEVINAGEWPEQYAADKPIDLKDAVKRIMKPMSSTAQAWQKAYAMTFGIEAVVKIMKTPTRIAILETMYTREEIKPFLKAKNDHKLKGRWLEDDLGM